MAIIEFQDEEGNIRSVCLEDGCMPFGDDEDVEAFYRLTKREEGTEKDGDDDDEHYLSDIHPVDPETNRRVDEDEIDWSSYEKCRYGCQRQFWYTGKHDCVICGVIACKSCAHGSGTRCSSCTGWICGNHEGVSICSDCKS